MFLFSYSFWELCKTKKDEWRKEAFFLPQPSIPTPPHRHFFPSLPLSVSTLLSLFGSAYFAGDANDPTPPICILMQGLSSLFPFIHIQMCSYCLFALGPFKMPFWNMPFDKHIIGQVPAVMRVLFNVSKLESEWRASGPVAICSPLASPLDMSLTAGKRPGSGRMTLSTTCHPLCFIPTWRCSTGGETLENRLHRDTVLSAGRLDFCTLSQRYDRRTAL